MNPPILLVEDDPSDIDLTRRAFRKNRVANELVCLEDGEEALSYLFGAGRFAGRDPLDLPALTLLDLNLPKISGLDVLRRIRADERTRRLPVVILTSSMEDRDVAVGYEIGVNSYLRKPVDFDAFVEVLRHLELYWLVLNVPPPNLGIRA